MSDVLTKRCDWCGELGPAAERELGDRGVMRPSGWGEMSFYDGGGDQSYFDLCGRCLIAVRLTRTHLTAPAIETTRGPIGPDRLSAVLAVPEAIRTGQDRSLVLRPPPGGRLRVAGFTFGWAEMRYVYMTMGRVGNTSILRTQAGEPVALETLHSEGFPKSRPPALVDHVGGVDEELAIVISNLRVTLPPAEILVHLLPAEPSP